MSVTEKQRAANQANAKKSTGPNTADGKAKSSMNALRHGITAQTTLMTDDDRIHHDKFCADLIADLAPVGSLETYYASSFAEEAWRLNASRAQADNLVALGHFDGTGDAFTSENPAVQAAVTEALTVRDQAKNLALMSLYDQRRQRAMEKFAEKLEKLQTERKAKHEKDLEEARKFFQMAEIKNIPWTPAADGFVFSTDEIARYTSHYHRRAAAKEADYTYTTTKSGPKEVPKAA